MKVNNLSRFPVSDNRSSSRLEERTSGQPEQELQEDADLFKQAMSDTENRPPVPDDRISKQTAYTQETPQRDSGTSGQAGPDSKQQSDHRVSGQTARHDQGTQKKDAGASGQARHGNETKASLPDAAGGKRLSGDGITTPAGGKHLPDNGASGPAAHTKQTLEKDAGAFKQAMSETGNLPQETGKEKKHADASLGEEQDLQQLLASQMQQSQNMGLQRTEAKAPQTISPELVEKVAQRILVSAGNDGQNKEVRIQIKDTLLQDTEVIISRDKGEVVLNFVTQSPNDSALLGRSRDMISSALEQALDSPVQVNVNADTDDSPDRRSRGMYIEAEEE